MVQSRLVSQELCERSVMSHSEVPILIIDMQGFQYKRRGFILKELAAIYHNTGQQAHYLFKSPYPFLSLTQEEKVHCQWLEKNYHCLSWRDGYVHLSELSKILQRLCRIAVNTHPQQILSKDVIVVCKGSMKKHFLQPHLKWNKIIDLDDYSNSLPSLRFLNGPRCAEHIEHFPGRCALTNVYFINKLIVDGNIKLR